MAETDKFKDKFAWLQEKFDTKVKQPIKLNVPPHKSECKTIANLEMLYPYRQFSLELAKFNRLKSKLKKKETCYIELVEISENLGLPSDFPMVCLAHNQFIYSNDELLTPESRLEVKND